MEHSLLAIFVLSGLSFATTLTYNWEVSWIQASPDGFSRPVIGVNGAWPCPEIRATVGDEISIIVKNSLGNESISLHWHGLAQYGTNDMDGASMVNQCPIPSGSIFTYRYTVDSPGTFWWHAHLGGQYMDGLRGALIVHGEDPYADQYDEEKVLTLSDWYHQQSTAVAADFRTTGNNSLLIPDSILISESSSPTYHLKLNCRYKFRVISTSGSSSIFLKFDGHVMIILEIDGVNVEKSPETHTIRVAPGQRYAFLLIPKSTKHYNYAVTATLEVTVMDPDVAMSTTGYLIYDDQASLFTPFMNGTTNGTTQYLDDLTLLPLDGQILLPAPDQMLTYNVSLGKSDAGFPASFMNGIAYVNSTVPTLYTTLSAGANSADANLYGQINAAFIQSGQIIQVIINNLTPIDHPFHLHGHQFQVLARPATGTGIFAGGNENYPATPMRRDTIVVTATSYVVIRFLADNPGTHLLHCHNEWHMVSGMAATLIEGAQQLQEQLASFTAAGLPSCEVRGSQELAQAPGTTSAGSQNATTARYATETRARGSKTTYIEAYM